MLTLAIIASISAGGATMFAKCWLEAVVIAVAAICVRAWAKGGMLA